MRIIRLRGTSIDSSVLGFGCVSLTLHKDRQSALDLLEKALECGITHFDVARAYGFGEAESILGEFLRGKRHRLTVTSKFGLKPNPALAKHRRLVRFGRRMLRRFKFLSKIVQIGSSGMVKRGAFSPADAQESLETSLRELKSDYIDVFQLHQCTLADAQNDELLGFLEDQVRSGKVRYCGVGTDFPNLQGDAALLPPLYKVLQFDHHAMQPNVARLKNARDRGIISFGAFRPLAPILAAAGADPRIARQIREVLNVDVTDPRTVTSLLLHYSLHTNPDGIVLFGTTKAQHVVSNVQSVANQAYSPEQLEQFARTVQELTFQTK